MKNLAFVAHSDEKWLYSTTTFHYLAYISLYPFTPKSDQYQVSPGASSEILHSTVWITWLFIAYSDERWLYLLILTTSLVHFSLKGWENVLFELGSEKVKNVRRVTIPAAHQRFTAFSLSVRPDQRTAHVARASPTLGSSRSFPAAASLLVKKLLPGSQQTFRFLAFFEEENRDQGQKAECDYQGSLLHR